MGFYGHITNIQKTSMTFDKIYSNRTAMDAGVNSDGVYAGRYVLIEYSNPLDSTLLTGVVQFDGMLYPVPPARDPSSWNENDKDPTSPTSYLVKLDPLQVKSDIAADVADGFVKPGIAVVCPIDFNLVIVQTEDGDKKVSAMATRKQYFRTSGSTTTKMSYNLLYNYKDQCFQMDDSNTREEKTGCSYLEINYSSITTDSEAADANYLINFNIDIGNYNNARGYDSTVWQKTYADGRPKYVMIAELNSVVPILDVAADAPTMAPVMPHFDKDSTNIYYKLHMQPSWGFRIKAANHNLKIPTLDYSGSEIYSGQYKSQVFAGSHLESYPSDEKVPWMNTIYDKEKSDYVNQYLVTYEENSSKGVWEKDPANGVDGAIYYNKAGFNKARSFHSTDLDRVGNVQDEISLTPSGYSGHLYPTHTTNGENVVQPDVNELTIMLPSIGDTVADMWDLIYGDTAVNGSALRNLVIRWEDAKKVLAKEGLRLVRNDEQSYGYTYSPEEVNTLAGVINSAQDILGMIITKDYPEDVSSWNEEYIYYDVSTGKYHFKKQTYEYEPIEGDVAYEKVDLLDWEEIKNNAWWIDTGSTVPDYMQEQTFRPERSYVSGVNVPTDVRVRNFSANVYTPGAYFLYTDKNASGKDLIDDVTKASYHRYYVSNEEYDVNHRYYTIKATPVTLDSKVKFYIPNRYYEGHFIKVEIANESDFERKIADGVRLFVADQRSPVYGITKIGFELKTGDYAKAAGYDIYYLTLKTCSLSEQEYIKSSGSNRPILFQSNFKSTEKDVQNYYVIDRKFELFTDTTTISNSPGVYYYLDLKGTSVNKFLNSGTNILAKEYESQLALEKDVVINEDAAYFREVVELKLDSADNIVDIAGAEVITVESLESNLYIWEAETESYRSISALSKEIVQTSDYSTISNLYKLEISDLVVGYAPNKYYYQVEDGDYKNSIVLDNHLEPVLERDYYTASMINKRLVTEEEVAKGRQPDTVYYYYDINANDYFVYNGVLTASGTFYVSSLNDLQEIYYPHKYYYKNGLGEFVLDTSLTFTPGREYYRNPQLYIIEDPNGFYAKGSVWPLAENPPAGSGIVLGTRKETWEKGELKGFDVNFNTLHGILLRLNQWMLQNDELTRDETTLQGALNKLNDLIRRFGSMEPGELMMVDNTGRMSGVNYTTAQEFSAVNHGGQGVKIVSTEADTNGEDQWIDFDTDTNYVKPLITIKHNFTKVEDTTSTSNNNTSKTDSINLYTPIVDAKGHVVGKNTETVTLPFGFKTIATTNDSTESLSQETLAVNSDIVADNTQDTLKLSAGNKWIEFTTDANNDTITIAHKARNVINDGTTETTMDSQASEDGRNKFGPLLADVDYDPAGHVIARTYKSYKLPNSYQSFTDEKAHMSTATNAHDTFTILGDTWLNPVIAQGSLTYSHKVAEVTTPDNVTIVMDTATDRNTFGPVVSDFEWDEAGHITAKSRILYTLPNGYQSLAVSETEKTTAINTHDTLMIAGDDWTKPEITQGTLTYKHINNKLEEGFVASGSHALGAQTPQFGETFNMQVYSLDDNGHIVNKTTETVLVPTDIRGLLLTSYKTEDNHYLTSGSSLEAALESLDLAIYNLQSTVDTNQTTCEDELSALEESLQDLSTTVGNNHRDIQEALSASEASLQGAIEQEASALSEAITNNCAAVQDNLDTAVATIAETYSTIESVNELSNAVIHKTQTFIYTPEVVEESHEATQEEVDAGLATEVGEKIIDVEHIPAEEMTIEQLFVKVKLLEALVNSLKV